MGRTNRHRPQLRTRQSSRGPQIRT
jgi:hypothetical protein